MALLFIGVAAFSYCFLKHSFITGMDEYNGLD